jgi:hypothetical protein
MTFHALGAYPTDPYYDPNRPAWLPYWIDDATESAQKYGMYGGANVNTVYPNPPAPVPPVVQPDLTGQTTSIDAQITQTAAANAAQNQSFFNALAATLPNSTTSNASNSGIGVAWIYIGIGVVLLMMLRK